MTYNVAFCGGETAGGIAKIKSNNQSVPEVPYQVPDYPSDSVSFHGRDYDEKKRVSPILTIALAAAAAAGIIGGFGVAHQKKWIDKIGNESIKKFANAVCEPCHKWCSSLKKFGVENYNKIKDWIGKKK